MQIHSTGCRRREAEVATVAVEMVTAGTREAVAAAEALRQEWQEEGWVVVVRAVVGLAEVLSAYNPLNESAPRCSPPRAVLHG